MAKEFVITLLFAIMVAQTDVTAEQNSRGCDLLLKQPTTGSVRSIGAIRKPRGVWFPERRRMMTDYQYQIKANKILVASAREGLLHPEVAKYLVNGLDFARHCRRKSLPTLAAPKKKNGFDFTQRERSVIWNINQYIQQRCD